MRRFYVQFWNATWIQTTMVKSHYTNYSTVSHHRSTMNWSKQQYWNWLYFSNFFFSPNHLSFHSMQCIHTHTCTKQSCAQIIYFSNVEKTLRTTRVGRRRFELKQIVTTAKMCTQTEEVGHISNQNGLRLISIRLKSKISKKNSWKKKQMFYSEGFDEFYLKCCVELHSSIRKFIDGV